MDLTDAFLSDSHWRYTALQSVTYWQNETYRGLNNPKTSVIYYSNNIWLGYHTARLRSRLGARDVGRFVTIRPKCQQLTKPFFRCFRKSMWWKGSFPPKPRWLLRCSFCLGGSINLHPDLVCAAALQHGSLMGSTSPMMEALPRLSQISKTDTLLPPQGQGVRLLRPHDAK